MTMTPGTRLGPYQIESAIGAGGMGEVYRAKDTRLDRTVAVKVLPAHLAKNPDFRQRFDREARAVSQFSHPHICALYDVGSEDGVDYLVMEYLEGETLAARLTKGALPVDQVLTLGVQMADALDRAHKQGIVHRDLKPGNVMLTKAGAKLLDFGLAKQQLASVETEISKVSSLPTRGPQDRALTEEGTILGTFQYMAPEQLEGKEADSRTDIFALGCVLHEMATGQKAFTGKSRASLIAAILEREPASISSIAPMTPPALDRVVKTCMAKEPDDRFQTAHDIKLQLEWIAEGGSQAGLPAPVAARRRSRERVAVAAAALLGLLAAVLGGLLLLNRSEPARVVQSSLLPPDKVAFTFTDGPMALSPDGTRLAFVGTGEGKSQLWIRPLSGMSAQALQGTEGAAYPFWSADSHSVGFFANGKLRKIDASGGPPESIADAPQPRAGTWNADGTILFSPTANGPIFKVPAGGGTPVAVTKLDESKKQTSHRWPIWLPDGRHFLYFVLTPQTAAETTGVGNGLWVGSLDGKEPKFLLKAESQTLYSPPGYILFWREGSLLAQRFDAGTQSLVGDAFPVAEGVQRMTSRNFAFFSISANGLLTYQGGALAGLSQLAWYDRTGREIEKISEPFDVSRPRLSHDGKRLAVDVRDRQSGNGDVWVYEFARKTLTRFTFNAALELGPVWSPDDSSIAFASNRKGAMAIFRKPVAGAGAEELLHEGPADETPQSWSGDGRSLLLEVRNGVSRTRGGGEIWSYSFADHKATPFLASEFNAGEPVFSPDGHFVLYASAESGRLEVYVQAFPGPGGKWQLSTEGGEDPAWSRDGKEIFYIAPGNRLMTVPVKPGPEPQPGTPRFLFEARFRQDTGQQYDISADGQRFLIAADLSEANASPVTLVQNWLTGRKR
jgi:eukaryotic-like serine/threonine-protein kinase